MKKSLSLTFKFLKILWKKNKLYEDYVNWWLILFKGTTLEEQLDILKKENLESFDESRAFYKRNAIKQWQSKLWEEWSILAYQRSKLQFFVERRPALRKNQIGWISWYTISRRRIKRSAMELWLNAAPSIK